VQSGWSAGGVRRLAVALAATGALAVAALAPAARASSDSVSVYPSPGTRYNQPQTQVSFRGVPPSQLGQLAVVGSKSGPHAGTIQPDSDGDGGSFIPSTPFVPGETVTVSSQLNVAGGKGGMFSFAIANPATPIGYGALPLVRSVHGGLQSFRSAPGLHPPTVDVTKNKAPASQGDIFVAPQFGPWQDGPMILDPQGRLVWFLPFAVQHNTLITDFRVQRLHGEPVLTWWQGNTNEGHGRGVGVIYNQQYQPVVTVKAGNGLDMDLHEFLVTNAGDAYFLSAWRVRLPGIVRPVADAVVQEVDIQTGLVLFQWDALDHIPLSQSYFTQIQSHRNDDAYHANAISLDSDGNLIVSMRNTSAIYKVNRETGQIMWTLGGKHSSFKMGGGTRFWQQHNALIHPREQMTIFDDEGAPPRIRPYSRAIRIGLNVKRKTASLIREYDHSPALPTAFEGSVQPLSAGDVFIGWGQQPYFSEDNARGRQIFDAHFAEPTSSYRAYRMPWNGQPPLSQLAASASPAPNGALDVYASWNGATQVASWRVLGGSSPTALSAVAQAKRTGFETRISVGSKPAYYAVQALDAHGAVLGTSAAEAGPA
jgi:hypothetical protein